MNKNNFVQKFSTTCKVSLGKMKLILNQISKLCRSLLYGKELIASEIERCDTFKEKEKIIQFYIISSYFIEGNG